jgi:ribonuclease Z
VDARRPDGGEPGSPHSTCIGAHKVDFERNGVHSALVDLDVVFLGTSGSMPTARRALPATLVRRGGERLLFDCSEGTQRQLLRSDVGLVDLEEIFLTHYHADHYLGLPGMLKTFALRGRDVPLAIYGPRGLGELMGTLRRVFGRLTYPVTPSSSQPGDRLERDGYRDRGVRASTTASLRSATRSSRRARPGRFDVDVADRLGVPPGASAACCSAARA